MFKLLTGLLYINWAWRYD